MLNLSCLSWWLAGKGIHIAGSLFVGLWTHSLWTRNHVQHIESLGFSSLILPSRFSLGKPGKPDWKTFVLQIYPQIIILLSTVPRVQNTQHVVNWVFNLFHCMFLFMANLESIVMLFSSKCQILCWRNWLPVLHLMDWWKLHWQKRWKSLTSITIPQPTDKEERTRQDARIWFW